MGPSIFYVQESCKNTKWNEVIIIQNVDNEYINVYRKYLFNFYSCYSLKLPMEVPK